MFQPMGGDDGDVTAAEEKAGQGVRNMRRNE